MILTPSKSALHCLSTLAFIFAGIAVAQIPGHQQPANLHVPHVDADFGKLPLSFEPNRGQTDPTVQFLARGSQYTVLLQPTAATLVLSREDAAARRAGRPVPATRAAIRMTLDRANTRAAMSADRPLPGYVNYITGDKAKTYTGIPTYAATRAAGVYPGIDLVYYGTARQLEYDFVVSPKSDPSLIHLVIGGARAVVESNGDLRLQIGATSRDTDIVFHKPVLYQQVDGARQSIDGAFTVAANNKVGFKIGAYDRSKELVIDPIISYASYFGGSIQDEITGTTINAANQLYAVGQTLSPTLPSGTGEFQPARSGVKNSNYHDGFVTKFSADGSSVIWSTYLAGSQDDFATGVAVNATDQAYVVGYTNSCLNPGEFNNTPLTAVRFPFTSDAIQPLCNGGYNQPETGESDGGNSDAFLVKLSSDGKTELYGTPLGGSQNDYASSIVLDATGRPYIVGETNSTQYYKCATVGPHCNDVPSYPVDNHGNADIGPTNYPTTPSAFYSNVAESIQYSTTDSSGNTGGPQDEQAFITILSADLHSFVYSSLIGGGVIGGCGNGACNTNGLAVAVNAAGQAFIGGNTSSAHWPTTAGAFATSCPNARNANSQCPMTGWLAGFDPSKSGVASLLFSTYMNGSSAGADSNGNPLYPGGDVYGVATDSTGNVVATGDTNANNFPTTTGVLQPGCAIPSGDGNGDVNVCANAFVTKLSPTGATVWSTYYRGTGSFFAGEFVAGQGVALDTNNNVYVMGLSNVETLPLKNPISTNPARNSDAFLIELSPDASTLLMGTFFGSTGGITVNTNSLHLDSNLNAYFAGYITFNGNDYIPTTPGAFNRTGFGASTSGFVAKMITQQQPTAETLTVSPNPASPTQTVILTATVLSTSALTGIPTSPTGTVSFMNGATVVGTGTLNAAGIATFSGMLAGGAYNITAVYPGDSGFNGATSNAVALTVSSAVTTTTTLTVAPVTSMYGTAEVLTATVNAGTAAPTAGTVTFTAGSVSFGSASVNAQGVATVTVTPPVGVYSVIATYAGTYNQTTNPTGYGPSASTGASLTVTKAASTTALTSSTTSASTATNFTLTAAVTTGATGTVTFYNGAISLGTGAVGIGGTATLTTSIAAAGSYSLTAVYSGDTNFTGSTSPALTLVVAGAAATPTFSVPAGTYATTQTVTISDATAGATIYYTTNGTTPTTSSSVYSGAITVSSSETLEAIATASGYTTSAVASAAYVIQLGLTTPTVTVTPASSSITTAQSLSVPISLGGGQCAAVRRQPTGATVRPETCSTLTPTGTVTLSGGGYTSAAATLSGGTATIMIPAGSLATGTDTLTATYTPDSNSTSTYTSATGTNTVTVTAAVTSVPVASLTPASLTFTAVTGATSAAQVATLSNTGTATLTISGITITGTNPSAFAIATGTNVCGTSLAASSSCSIYVTFTPASAATFSATLSVADNASGSPQTTTLSGTGTAAAAPVAALTPATLTFTAVTGATSTAQFATLSNTGNAALTISGITIGGTNPADFAITTGTSACGSSLAASSSCSIYVTFTPASAASFTATLSVADNASGSPQTTALSGTGTAAVAPTFTLSSPTAPQTVQPGADATYTITGTAQNGTFSSVVTLAASGLPTGATASFSPTSITPGSTSGSSTLTIQTSAVATATPLKNPQWPLAAPVLALIGLFFLPGKKRRRWITLALLLFASLGAFTALTACGGGFGLVRVIPPASYTITVTGTSGAEQQITTVQLTVQ